MVITSMEKNKLGWGKEISRKVSFNFTKGWYGCLPDMTFVHRPKEGKEARQVDT